MKMKHGFYANNRYYELEETVDIFGCTCVSITENQIYRGCIDTADANDFLNIEERIINDPDYVYSVEVYA
ncbi:TPA: hypothetical protein PBT65_001720 [Staphylococcus aureus]|nr:hypothetical protein [Staphylococcus aureus]